MSKLLYFEGITPNLKGERWLYNIEKASSSSCKKKETQLNSSEMPFDELN
jgi:hypothetical protein